MLPVRAWWLVDIHDFTEPRHTAAPALCAAAVEPVEEDVKQRKRRDLLIGHHQASIG